MFPSLGLRINLLNGKAKNHLKRACFFFYGKNFYEFVRILLFPSIFSDEIIQDTYRKELIETQLTIDYFV